MKKLIWIFVFLPTFIYSQDKFVDNGRLELGLRTTGSLFGTSNTSGLGVGGQFRLRLMERINTEWFADYITNNIGGLGRRVDSHVGWSVMFYPLKSGRTVEPYIIAGHCFDYTKVSIFSDGHQASDSRERWSSAVQMGLGTIFNVTERINFTFSAQYMLHLGNDIHTHIHEENGKDRLHFKDDGHRGLEGHLFFTLSMNIKIADLW